MGFPLESAPAEGRLNLFLPLPSNPEPPIPELTGGHLVVTRSSPSQPQPFVAPPLESDDGQVPSQEPGPGLGASARHHPLAIGRVAVHHGPDVGAEQKAARELAVQEERLRGRLGETVLREGLDASFAYAAGKI